MAVRVNMNTDKIDDETSIIEIVLIMVTYILLHSLPY